MANEKRLIDADALLEKVQFRIPTMSQETKIVNDCVLIARKAIREAPTVDAVEVVRCKDCKYFKPAYFKADDGTETPWDETFSFDDRSDGIHYGARCKHERNTAYGEKDMAFRKPNDFCSYGERREGE